jgi:hypothetical protein
VTLTSVLTATQTGASSTPIDISTLPAGDWTINLAAILSPETTSLVSIQESADGFVSDIRTIDVWNPTSGTGVNTVLHAPALRRYQRPSARLGILNATMRLHLQAPMCGFNASIVATLKVEV